MSWDGTGPPSSKAKLFLQHHAAFSGWVVHPGHLSTRPWMYRGHFPRSHIVVWPGPALASTGRRLTVLGMGHTHPSAQRPLPRLQGGDLSSLLPSVKLSTPLCVVREVLRDQLSQDTCRGELHRGPQAVGFLPLELLRRVWDSLCGRLCSSQGSGLLLSPRAPPSRGDRCPSLTP
uniref:Uncharacterized protein n=1 Tax=Molossus molossus TaxID=27622 RepID=A0A7J8JXL1_MOLMO|nr:hypothetical protein HJG59_008098 [Molossus molossus]